jgi:hypothetical protein
MKPTITTYIGAPLSGSEARFLHTLYADLASTGALILANVLVGDQQIDFVVVTSGLAAVLELKNLLGPIYGDQNGNWSLIGTSGKRTPYPGMNPYRQALSQKYALSDAMKHYREQRPGIPPPAGRGFFVDLAAFVCIYPRIHSGSNVTAGDHKVGVRGYPDVLQALRVGGKASTWALQDWELFAEQHLHLSRATLQQATDPRIMKAYDTLNEYRERVRAFHAGLAPLADSDSPDYGSGLLARLQQRGNFLLLGPAGSTKTFHLHHLARALAVDDAELPLIIEARRYRGGEFWDLLKKSTAPFCPKEPDDLLEAAQLCGFTPALLIDALNECPEPHHERLLQGAQAFAIRFGSRAVLTSQRVAKLSGDLTADTISLPLPNNLQKRSIYAYHAGLPAAPDLDRFCVGFGNAYDLTIAGRCHASGAAPSSRLELYDRYVRRCLPDESSVAAALLRKVAGEMNDAAAFVWSRDAFETAAEEFLSRQGVALTLLDAVKSSHLVELTSDTFAFEHELLFCYFKAEDLRRRKPDISVLAEQLKRPRNHVLAEFIVPRYGSGRDAATLLTSVSDPAVLSSVCAGDCGRVAQQVVLEECTQLLDNAIADLPKITVSCRADETSDQKAYLHDLAIVGHREWAARHAVLCAVIARNLDHPQLQQKFLELLDATEGTLAAAVRSAAVDSRLPPGAVWGEAVRIYGGLLSHQAVRLPCSTILAELRLALMQSYSRPRQCPIRSRMLELVARNPASHFGLLVVLEDREAADTPELVAENLALVQRAWKSGIYILRIQALDYLRSMSSVVHRACPERISTIREMLQGFETRNIIVNTTLLETLTSYGGLDLGMTTADAVSEMRSLIAPKASDGPDVAELAAMAGVGVQQLLARRAESCLGKIFEDVFQGIYYDAYFELGDREKCALLCLAGESEELGFQSDWILQELLRLGDERALPVFRRCATSLDVATMFPQERVAAFALGIEGCARWSTSPPGYDGGASPAHQAWRIIGEILFWVHRGGQEGERTEALWTQLDGEALLAAGEVLYQLANSGWRLSDLGRRAVDLATLFPAQVRQIAETGLSQRGSLPSVFPGRGSRDAEVMRFLLATLGRVGDSTTIPDLRRLADDPQFGIEVLQAIGSIQRRAHR